MESAEPLRILLERASVLRSSFLASIPFGVIEPVGSGLGSLLLPDRADLLGTPASQKQDHVDSGKSEDLHAMAVLSENAKQLTGEDGSYEVQCAKGFVTTSYRDREPTPTSPSPAVVRLRPTVTPTVECRPRLSQSEPISAHPRTLTHNAVVGLRLGSKHVPLPVEDDSAFAIGETRRQWDRRFPVAHRIMRRMYGATLDRLQTLHAEHRKAKTLTSPTVCLRGRMHPSPTGLPLTEVVVSVRACF